MAATGESLWAAFRSGGGNGCVQPDWRSAFWVSRRLNAAVRPPAARFRSGGGIRSVRGHIGGCDGAGYLFHHRLSDIAWDIALGLSSRQPLDLSHALQYNLTYHRGADQPPVESGAKAESAARERNRPVEPAPGNAGEGMLLRKRS
jgi:hypothetical protein